MLGTILGLSLGAAYGWIVGVTSTSNSRYRSKRDPIIAAVKDSLYIGPNGAIH